MMRVAAALVALWFSALASAHTGTQADTVPLVEIEKFPSSVEWTPESGGLAAVRIDDTSYKVIHLGNQAVDVQEMVVDGGILDLLGGAEPHYLWVTPNQAYWVGAVGKADAMEVHSSSEGPPAGATGDTTFDSRQATNLVHTASGIAFGVIEYDNGELQWKLIREGDPWTSETIATFDSSYRFFTRPSLVVDDSGSIHMIGTYAHNANNAVESVGVHAYHDADWNVDEHPDWSVAGTVTTTGPSNLAAAIVMDTGATELRRWDGSTWAFMRDLDAPGPDDLPLNHAMVFLDGNSIVAGFNQARSGTWDMHVLWANAPLAELNLPQGHQLPLVVRGDVTLFSKFEQGQGSVVGVHRNGGPIASFTNDAQGTTRQAVSFDSAAVMGDSRSLASASWSFGASGETASHVFSEPGRHYVTLTVTDDQGGTDTATGPVDIAQIGPTACIDVSSAGTTGATTSISDCSTHPESSLGATIDSYDWNFGDGTTSTAANPSHTYTSPGTYTITLTVTDEQGTTDTATKTITVTDPPPNQKPTVSVSFTPEAPVAGQEVTFTATASDSDGSITSKAWTVDGTATGSGNSVTQTFTEAGIVQVAFTATDDDGASTTVTKSVNVQAPAPPEISLSQTQITDKSGQVFTIDVTVTNPNPVPVTVDLASDAPDAWNPTFDASSIELAAGETTTIAYTITPPYTVGGLTIITIEASTGDATDSVILRAQFTVGEAPETDEPADDPVDEATDDQPVTNIEQKPTDSKSGVPTWAWFAGGSAIALAGVGATLVLVLRKP